MHAGKVRFYPVPNLVISPFINWLMSFYPSVNQKIGDTFLIKAYTRRIGQCPSFWPIGTFLAGRTVDYIVAFHKAFFYNLIILNNK